MKNELLDVMKQEYKDVNKIQSGDYSEIKELEKNPLVIRYLYLTRIKKLYDLGYRYEWDSIYSIIDKYGHGLIMDTNNIWCIYCVTKLSKVKQIPVFYNDKEPDLNDTVYIYKDIEDSTKTIAVSVDSREQFEATHKVTYGNYNIQDNEDRYNNIRFQFFNDCIQENQDIAIEKILSSKR